MQSDIATISVITSGLVAIATILLPLFFNFISDSMKWKRERRLSEIDKIENATTELMNTLSEEWAGNYDNTSPAISQNKQDWTQLRSRIFKSFYIWERTLLPYSDQRGRDKIVKVKDYIEKELFLKDDDKDKAKDNPEGNEDNSRQAGLSREIHELTHNAVKRVR